MVIVWKSSDSTMRIEEVHADQEAHALRREGVACRVGADASRIGPAPRSSVTSGCGRKRSPSPEAPTVPPLRIPCERMPSSFASPTSIRETVAPVSSRAGSSRPFKVTVITTCPSRSSNGLGSRRPAAQRAISQQQARTSGVGASSLLPQCWRQTAGVQIQRWTLLTFLRHASRQTAMRNCTMADDLKNVPQTGAS